MHNSARCNDKVGVLIRSPTPTELSKQIRQTVFNLFARSFRVWLFVVRYRFSLIAPLLALRADNKLIRLHFSQFSLWIFRIRWAGSASCVLVERGTFVYRARGTSRKRLVRSARLIKLITVFLFLPPSSSSSIVVITQIKKMIPWFWIASCKIPPDFLWTTEWPSTIIDCCWMMISHLRESISQRNAFENQRLRRRPTAREQR